MRRYKTKDLVIVNAWRRAHRLPAMPAEALPELGYVVDDVAAGFLFRTDAPAIAFLDAFVSCPIAPLRSRRAALIAIIERLCEDAKRDGVRHVIGLTERRSMARLVEGLGFRSHGLCELLRKEAA